MDFESESEEEEQGEGTIDYVPKQVTQQKKQTGIFSLFKYIYIFITSIETLFEILRVLIETWWDQRPSLKK